MPKTKMPSPARSQGGITTPKSKKSRRSRSLCSPALSTASGRLTSLIDQFKDKNMESFALSPLNGRSVLNDDTDIVEPRRKSWWKNLNENSQDVMEVLEDNKVTDANNDIEELIDIEVLSQEKKEFTLDLPESSDNESINSIVLPQRRLFTQKENQPQKKFGELIGNRETLAKLHKTNTTNIDKTVNVGTRELFQNTKRSNPIFPSALLNISPNKTTADKTRENIVIDPKPTRELFQNAKRSKPIFPAALLNISPNKTAADKTKENVVAEPKPQVRNIFGNRATNKRKNIFADFIVSESEDEISDIQPKVFGFQKKLEQRRISSISKGRDPSPTSSITTDIEMEDWKLLPSSTMVEMQLEDMVAGNTPIKRARLSKLSEAKESEAGTNTLQTNTTNDKTKQSNKSVSSKNKSKSSPEVKDMTLNNSRLTRSMLKNASKRKEDVSNTVTIKSRNEINEVVDDKQNIDTKNAQDKSDKTGSDDVEQNDQDDDENNFRLEYENDDNELVDEVAVNNDAHKNHKDNIKNQNTVVLEKDSQEDEINKSSATNKSLQKPIKTIEESVESQQNEQLSADDNVDGNQENDQEPEANQNQESENDDNESKETAEVAPENQEDESNRNENEVNISKENNKDEESVTQENEHEANESDNNEDEVNVSQENEDEHDENQEDIANESQEVDNELNDNEEDEDEANESDENEDNANVSDINEDEANESQEVEAEANESQEISKEANESQKVEAKVNESQEINDEANESQEVEAKVNESQEINDEANESQEVEDEPNESQELGDKANQSENIEEEANKSQAVEDDDVSDGENDEEIDENDASDEENDEEIDENEDEAANESRINEASANESQEVENEEEEASHEVDSEADANESEEIDDDQMEDSDEADKAIATDADMSEQDDDDIQADEMEVDDDDPEASEDENEQNQNASHEDRQIDKQNEPEPSAEEIEESPNVTHDTTGRNRKKEVNKSPEVILTDKTNQMDSFLVKGRNTSARKTKSMIKNLNIRPSLAPPRDSIGFSDGTTNSSAEGSGWDSHRTTRKTLRLTFGKDFTPRKSLRTLVMEKSAKRQAENLVKQAENLDIHSETVPQANSTEFPEDSNRDVEDVVESDHEVSRRTRQTTLEMYLQKIKQQNIEKKLKMEEAVRNSLKAPVKDTLSLFKVPNKPAPRRPKPAQSKPKKQFQSMIPLQGLSAEVIEDMKYKPPKRFRPANASWITKRLYKFLENKLEAKYDYKARVRAEKLVETIYHFAKDLRRHNVAPADAVNVLKHELARLDVVHTHFEFYEFFHEFMPREVRIKVVPDIVNKIPLPRHGVFSDILRGDTVQG